LTIEVKTKAGFDAILVRVNADDEFIRFALRVFAELLDPHRTRPNRNCPPP
jgi:hypothetical protein